MKVYNTEESECGYSVKYVIENSLVLVGSTKDSYDIVLSNGVEKLWVDSTEDT